MAETLAYPSEPPPTPAAVATAIPGQKWNSIHPWCLAGSDTDHTHGSSGGRGEGGASAGNWLRSTGLFSAGGFHQRPRSSTSTFCPAAESRQALMEPPKPLPMITTSKSKGPDIVATSPKEVEGAGAGEAGAGSPFSPEMEGGRSRRNAGRRTPFEVKTGCEWEMDVLNATGLADAHPK